jgi:hypothetical protein
MGTSSEQRVNGSRSRPHSCICNAGRLPRVTAWAMEFKVDTVKTLASRGAIPYCEHSIGLLRSMRSQILVRMKQVDKFKPNPTARATGWYWKTYLRVVELSQ